MAELTNMEIERRQEIEADFKFDEMIFKKMVPSFTLDFIEALNLLTKIKKEKTIARKFNYKVLFSHRVNKLNGKKEE